MAQVQRKRYLWYYDSIIDWMIANPGRPLTELAKYVGRSPVTISIIINSDMFKAHLAARRQQFAMHHDLGIIQKTTKIAHASLDTLLDVIEKKRDAIPINELREISDSALARLGYSSDPGKPGVQVNITQQHNQQVVYAPVSQQDLMEARLALRQVQETKARLPEVPAELSNTEVEEPQPLQLENPAPTGPLGPPTVLDLVAEAMGEAGPAKSSEEEETRAPSPLAT